MNGRLWLAAALALAGCRSALGISELDESADDVEGVEGAKGAAGFGGFGGQGGVGVGGGVNRGGGANEAGGGGTTSGQAGAPGGGGAGGAVAGGGRGGAAGAGGSGGPDEATIKACQQQCKDDSSFQTVQRYFDLASSCACEAGDFPSCEPEVCFTCLIEPGTFSAQTAACIACIGEKFGSKDCKDEANDCEGECETFADCIEGCSPSTWPRGSRGPAHEP